MTDFQSEFDNTTNAIDDLITTQLSSAFTWRNVPGFLVKASSSSGGYVWGYNANSGIYICQVPCSGNWTPVSTSGLLTVLDLTTDSSNVYILGNNKGGNLVLSIGPINNQGAWNSVSVPFAATKIFSTYTYIWAQDSSNNKQKCAKPCMAAKWIPVSEKVVSIKSSSDTSLYGTDPSGIGMKVDELMQSEWTPINGLETMKLTSLIGDLDKVALYAVDDSSVLLRYDGTSDPVPVDTVGNVPAQMTIDPSSKQLWMTSESEGSLGNIFNRSESSDYSAIMNNVTPLTKKRDAIVSETASEYSKQTDVMTLNKQVSDIVSFFKTIFNKTGDTSKSTTDAAGKLKDDIYRTQSELDQIQFTQPLIQNIVFTLVCVGLIYLVGSILGKLIHLFAFIVLLVGLYYSINFSQGTNNG